jgi:hypothetical protein
MILKDPSNTLDFTNALTNRSITANTNGLPIDLQQYKGGVAFLVATGNATAGTTPTLDISISHSSDNTNWSAANISGSQATNMSTQAITVDTRSVYRYVRPDLVIGGTNSPAFPVSVTMVGQKERD